MSIMVVLSVNMVTANVLLSVFFVSAVWAACPPHVDFVITTPEKMEALSGSCLHIPCNFSDKNKQDFEKGKTIGVWLKNQSGPTNKYTIFNSDGRFNHINHYQMRLTGDLSEKNCSTLFPSLLTHHSDLYYFRVESESFKATAVCDPLQITVKDSPPRPTITISGDLKEKESVTITCSAPTPCPHSPPRLTWSLQQDPHNIIEQNTDRTLATKIQKTITLSDQHDGSTITCSARYPVSGGQEKTAEETKTLSVSYAPKDTSVSIRLSGLVSAGSWVNLTCSSRANPPVNRFTWFKKSKDGAVNVSEGPNYSFNTADGGVYYCVVAHALGHQTSGQINLNTADHCADSFPWWGSALAGITVTVLIGSLICVWWFKSKHQTPPPPQFSQSQRSEELALETRASNSDENIHYGEMDFSRRSPEPLLAQGSVQQQDTTYAEVKASTNGATQTTCDLEDLYAQVTKK